MRVRTPHLWSAAGCFAPLGLTTLGKFLVYDYIDRGNLHETLENDDLAKELNWQRRAAIARDIAQAMCYLHHECNPPIIHRDITSNNILLDADFKAYVADFGIARIIKPDSSNWSELAGTYGYIAPGMLLTSFCLHLANI